MPYPRLEIEVRQQLPCVQHRTELRIVIQEKKTKQVKGFSSYATVPKSIVDVTRSRKKSLGSATYCKQPRNQLSQQRVQAVEEEGFGETQCHQRCQQLHPSTLFIVAKVSGLAIKGDDFLDYNSLCFSFFVPCHFLCMEGGCSGINSPDGCDKAHRYNYDKMCN